MDLNENNVIDFIDSSNFSDLDEENKKYLLDKLLKDLSGFLGKMQDCDGKVTITYKYGIPAFMSATFESIKDKEEYEKYKDFVGDYGFVTHKKYGKVKKLYGEKNYKYFKFKEDLEYGTPDISDLD